MAASGSLQKRKHLDQQPQVNHSHEVIVLSDDDDDHPVISEPPQKRQKSETPNTNGRSTGQPALSRDRSRNGNGLPSRASTPTNAQAPIEPKQKRSPWQKRSQYALQRPDDRERQYPTTTRNSTSTKQEESPRQPFRSVAEKLATIKNEVASISRSSDKVPLSLFKPLKEATPLRFKTISSIKQPPKNAIPRNQALSVDIPSRQKAPESTPKAQNSSRFLQPRIEVIVPSSQELLQKWSGPVPKAQSTLNQERRAMLKELKKSPTIVKERPEEARRLFGVTFSNNFAPESDDERMKIVASKKAKKVSRKTIQLQGDDLAKSFQHLDLGRQITIHPAQAVREVLTNRFNEQLSAPITFANDVNERRLPGKFQFVDHYVIRDGVKLAPTSRSGCLCEDCRISTCTCFTKAIEDREDKTTRIGQNRTYTRRPDGLVVLSDDYIEQELDKAADHFEITECNEFCRCGNDCLNRVVGKGRTVPLEIFQTEKCGFGVRSSQDIVRGQFIDTYLGEILTEAELCQREDAGEEGEPSYIHSLDWFDYNSDKNYHVDGKNFGTPMRFVNHSCNPNARSFVVQMHKDDKKVYHLAFFAIRSIPAGTEIRIDYSGGADQDEELNAELADGFTRCYCGEKNCRKRLWRPGVKTRRRRRKVD
ncbi:histone-lysine N-methyltransferase SUV39H [Exophiala viscosa]|uniref:Histone-lysine N-methyltransferase SUV39H n=1 Tax=Exophiala viscosa TaxID=2486360 RepID=A0AAN6DNU4_9EURO|nr:histone-lysine N-methyltransferase SUV39H [Exophiala viscosa]KAI1620529.1 histone-lysine N-methyltransferase SUV39H [Exophiala viscosa]